MSTRDQPYRIKTPLPEAELWLDSFTCQEGLSQLGRIEATLFSPRADIDANDLLGKTVSFEMALPDDNKRHFHGYITRFGYVGAFGSQHVYQALVRPWLWFLTRTTDCRIFQDMKVPDIVKTVFADHGVATFDLQLFRDYRVWEYCVQYRESDFDFVSRLLEHEGIYYRFEHEDGRHKLILLDSISAHDPQPAGLDRLPFYGSGGDAPPDIDYVSRWTSTQTIRPSKFASADYDFQNPHLQLRVSDGRPRGHDQGEAEVFDFPGGYTKTADGAQYMEDRLDESDSLVDTIHAATNAQNLRVGFSFSLQRHAREDPAAEWIVTQMSFQARNGSSEAGGGGGGFHCDFQLQDKRRQFRPQRTTPKPVVQGLQSAVVVGPKGDEIHTDKYGRIRVKFHWDRAEHRDERSSCWVRVAQQWAGKNFGAMFIPRIGHEVLVSFLEGDPDQPIVTGCVYNGDNMPPWGLPANATQSGWLTRSSKGGAYGNANMIRFEDKKGSEELSIHAERNMSTSVELNDSQSVGQDQSIQVGRDQKMMVKRDRTVNVEKNEAMSVGLSQALKVGTDQSVHVVGKQTTQVDGAQSITVNGNLATVTKASRIDQTTANESRKVGGNQTFEVGGLLSYKAATMVFEAGHIEHKVTGANSVVHTSPNGPYTIMANKFTLLSNTDTSIMSVGNINQTSIGSNTTVMGSNSSGYIGSASSTSMGMARNTFLGLMMENFLGAKISNSAALMFEATAALKLSIAVGMNLEMNSMKMYVPPGGAAAAGGGATAVSEGAAFLGTLGVLEGVSVAMLTTILGLAEMSDQYDTAKSELQQAANEAAAAGHPGLAARLNRLAAGDVDALGGEAPTSTQYTRGSEFTSDYNQYTPSGNTSSQSSSPAPSGADPGPNYSSDPSPNYSSDPSPNYSSDPTPNYSSDPTPSYSSDPSPNYSSDPGPNYSSDPSSSGSSSSSSSSGSAQPNASFPEGSGNSSGGGG